MTTKNNGPDAPVKTPAPTTIDGKLVPTKRDRLSKARTKDGLTLKELSFLTAHMSPSSPTYGNITRSALAARISRTAKSAVSRACGFLDSLGFRPPSRGG